MNPASPWWEIGLLHKPCVVPTTGPLGTSQSLPTVSQQLPTDLAAWRSLGPNLTAGTSLRPGAWACAAAMAGRQSIPPAEDLASWADSLGRSRSSFALSICTTPSAGVRGQTHSAGPWRTSPRVMMMMAEPAHSAGCNHPKHVIPTLPLLTAATHPQKALGDKHRQPAQGERNHKESSARCPQPQLAPHAQCWTTCPPAPSPHQLLPLLGNKTLPSQAQGQDQCGTVWISVNTHKDNFVTFFH